MPFAIFGGKQQRRSLALDGGVSAFVPANSSFFDGGGQWYARVDYLKTC